MRKLLAMGVTAMSALALTVGSAGVAKADVVPPGGIVIEVCRALPTSIDTVAKQVASANTALALATTDLSAKNGELAAAVNTLVGAIVNHVNTVSKGGNVTASGQQLSAAGSTYADKLTAWSQAFDKLSTLQKGAQVLSNITSPVLNGIDTGLACP